MKPSLILSQLMAALLPCILFLLLPARSHTANPPEKGVWYQLEMTGDMSAHLLALDEDEKWEQCRDWVVFFLRPRPGV